MHPLENWKDPPQKTSVYPKNKAMLTGNTQVTEVTKYL